MEHKFPYIWRLSDGYPAKGIEYHGCKVFGTFICGGGSSMGYKLAGYEHLGGVEIDPKVAKVYELNNHPLYLYIEDLREFNKRENLPDDLYDLDLLDGSPPCSTFSMAGSREKAWGKKKRFAEGQQLQTLDDLVFVYLDTILKLKPRVCLLENVAGLIRGNAKVYTKEIVRRLQIYGYRVQVFCLNAATMGVPQTRERVFIVGLRKEFNLPKLVLQFNEKPILFSEIIERGDTQSNLSEYQRYLWVNRKPSDMSFGDIVERLEHRTSMFNNVIFHADRVAFTLASQMLRCNALYDIPRRLNNTEIKKISTFPIDYNPNGGLFDFYCGMSVPPVMTAQIAHQIYLQWLSKIKK